MKKIGLSELAERILDNYFESYQGSYYNNDMQKRAFNYSRVISYLAHIDVFFDDIYIDNGKKYINIQDICTVEFSIENNEEVLIKNIYFKN
ncbi:MAG: hypothetical protein LBN27_05480 [Prevotellaceae bacterium]|jgi:hypothetical protein|nr:hypothetical protein [Prevotellaceae bacterium]